MVELRVVTERRDSPPEPPEWVDLGFRDERTWSAWKAWREAVRRGEADPRGWIELEGEGAYPADEFIHVSRLNAIAKTVIAPAKSAAAKQRPLKQGREPPRPPQQSEHPNSALPAWVAEATAALPALCTISEAAEALRVSTRTVARYVASGLLNPVARAGEGSARALIPRSEIVRYLAQRR